MNTDILITCLSWEDRYLLGLEQNIKKYNPSVVLVILHKNDSDTEMWKQENWSKTQQLLNGKLKIIETSSGEPSVNWFAIKQAISENCVGKSVLLDITTMTREIIWYTLYNCKINKCLTSYIYYRPSADGYSQEWISRDPEKPRLLYKMSGIAKLGAPTLLVVTGGYDIQRLDNLIYNFEPAQTMLFFQNNIDQRNKDNYINSCDFFRTKYKVEMAYQYDAYNVSSSFDLILEKIQQGDGNNNIYIENYNIILNSLGSKTSAITLFNIWQRYPHVALSYIPSKEYNREYSKGIGDFCYGEIPMNEMK